VARAGWRSLPIGGVLSEGGTSVKYKTGEWRSGSKPSADKSKCTNCLICWIYCPEPTIVPGEKNVEIDLTYCKGCGICAAECPVKAISMVGE